MVTSSHNYQLTIEDGNKCTWAFNNINLPDSNINEELSHGYIVYTVKAKKNIATGDAINNTGYIYFDYNLPVQTNTNNTLILSETLPVKLLTFTAKNNGKFNVVEWNTAEEVFFSHFEIERSTNGADFISIGKLPAGRNTYSFIDHAPSKRINYYRLKMFDKDGRYEYSPIRVVDNISNFSVSVYPNPATKKLIFQIDSEQNTEIQLQIVTMDGKIIRSNKLSIQTGQQVQPIDISTLEPGNYILKITVPGKEQTVIKFQKL